MNLLTCSSCQMWLSLSWPLQQEATAPAGTETQTPHFLRPWEQSAVSSIDIPASCPRRPILGTRFWSNCTEYQESVSEGHKEGVKGKVRDTEAKLTSTSSWFSLLLNIYQLQIYQNKHQDSRGLWFILWFIQMIVRDTFIKNYTFYVFIVRLLH